MFVDFGSMPQENVSFQQLFEQGLASQQQKNWDIALSLYQKALDQGLGQLSALQLSAVYHNMSLIAHEKKDSLNAYVWSRKSIYLNSGNQIAHKSLKEFEKEFSKPQIPHQISGVEQIKGFVQVVPLDAWMTLTLILGLLAVKIFFTQFIKNKKSEIELKPTQNYFWPFLPVFALTIILISGSIVKWSDEQTPRAFIMKDKTAVQTAAGENKPVIFEAPAGTEVEVLQMNGDATQVRYPGAFSGWVLTKNLEFLMPR